MKNFIIKLLHRNRKYRLDSNVGKEIREAVMNAFLFRDSRRYVYLKSIADEMEATRYEIAHKYHADVTGIIDLTMLYQELLNSTRNDYYELLYIQFRRFCSKVYLKYADKYLRR